MFAPGPLSEVDHDVFVVHAEDDTPFVKGELLAMLGLPLDRAILSSELPFPGFTEQAIEDAVRRSRLTLAVVSPAYLRDRWAGLAELLSRNVRDDVRGGSLVPLLVADCDPPAILAQHEVLDCRTPQQREASTARLRARLGRPDPAVEPIACPYPGMQPFSAATAAQFHGRTKEIDEILGRLQAGEREIFVIGPSGSGKSSLVAAGVLPHLEAARARPGGLRFAVRSLRPGEHPTQRLADAGVCDLERLAGAPDRLLEREHCDRLLIFLDQFEELFALAGAEERGQFFRALRVLRADRRCHLIIALRADFYGALMSSELWPDIDGRFTRLEVAPLRGDALRAAIEAPAREAGVYLERALVERLMTDAAAEPGALPLLQEALVLLWARRSHRLLRLASYQQLGSDGRSGLAVALARRADAILHDLTPPEQVLARRILLHLVSFGEGRPDTRRQLPRAVLSGSGADTANIERVVGRLIDDRMLTSDTTLGGEPLIDLSHEALIAGWPAFQSWLQLRRDDEQRRRALEVHAAEWVRRGRGDVGLFDAIELAEAERWIAGETAQELGYSNDLQRFLVASRDALDASARRTQLASEQRAHEQRAAQEAIEEAKRQEQVALEQRARDQRAAQEARAKTRRRFTWTAIVALALFSGSLSFLWLAARDAQVKTQQQLGLNEQEQARLLAIDRQDPIDSIPHLVHAVRLGVDNPVLRTLLSEAARGMWRVTVRHGGSVQIAEFSHDSAHFVTASDDGTARIWDTRTGAPVGAPLRHGQRIRQVTFSPDDTRIVTASEDHSARVWDAGTGAPVGLALKHEQGVSSAMFSPDGTRVATLSVDGTARIWDTATGSPVNIVVRHGDSMSSVTFNSDGTRLVTTSGDGAARIWDAATGAPVGISLKLEPGVQSSALSADGTRVVTVSGDTARIWDAVTGSRMTISLKHDQWVSSATFSPDGTRVLTTSGDWTARVWDAATGAPVGVPLAHAQSIAMFSADATRVLTASNDFTAQIWNAASAIPIGAPLQHKEAVMNAAFSPDGTRVVTASVDGTARIWDAMTGFPLGVPLQHEQVVLRAAFSPDGARVVTASEDGTARIWNTVTGSRVGVALNHDRWVWSAAFSPGGERIVTGSSNGMVRILDAATGSHVAMPFHHEAAVLSTTFNPDGMRVLIACSDGSAHIWSVGEAGALSTWIAQARTCAAPAADAIGSAAICAFAARKTMLSETITRVRSLLADGDSAMLSGTFRISHRYYQHAIGSLQDHNISDIHIDEREYQDLQNAIATRMAVLDALESHPDDARTWLGSHAPASNALLLDELGRFAHDELKDDPVALTLLLRAHNLDPALSRIATDLTETYFAMDRYDDLGRTAGAVNMRQASSDERLTLATLTWAAARLTRRPDGSLATQLKREYHDLADGAHIARSWNGTKYALKYRRVGIVETAPVLKILELLEQPVTDDTRAQLAELLQAPNPSESQTK